MTSFHCVENSFSLLLLLHSVFSTSFHETWLSISVFLIQPKFIIVLGFWKIHGWSLFWLNFSITSKLHSCLSVIRDRLKYWNWTLSLIWFRIKYCKLIIAPQFFYLMQALLSTVDFRTYCFCVSRGRCCQAWVLLQGCGISPWFGLVFLICVWWFQELCFRLQPYAVWSVVVLEPEIYMFSDFRKAPSLN